MQQTQQQTPDVPSASESRELKAKTSKYDFVKVRVWIGEHYYVLSRYLLSRMLMATRLPERESIRAALLIKKQLVDEGELDIEQGEFEKRLFATSASFSDPSCMQRYRRMHQFHVDGVSLVIVVTGAPTLFAASSTYYGIGTKLSTRLNLLRLVQTSMLLRLADVNDPSTLGTACVPELLQRHESDAAVLEAFDAQCETVQHRIVGDLKKCVNEGKSLVIEGLHARPSRIAAVVEELVARRQETTPEADQRHAPIIVPFVLRADTASLLLFAQDAFGSAVQHSSQDPGALLHNVSLVQDVVLAEELGASVLDVAMHEMNHAIDRMHAAILDRIDAFYEAHDGYG